MDLLPGAEPGFVKIIHPLTGGVAEVHQDGLAQWWRAGWVPLAADEPPPPEPEETSPPMTEDQVADGLAEAAPPAKAAKAGKIKE